MQTFMVTMVTSFLHKRHQTRLTIVQMMKHQERSLITLSHLSSKIFTASVNKTSGGNAPVDSIVTKNRQKSYRLRLYLLQDLIFALMMCACISLLITYI